MKLRTNYSLSKLCTPAYFVREHKPFAEGNSGTESALLPTILFKMRG